MVSIRVCGGPRFEPQRDATIQPRETPRFESTIKRKPPTVTELFELLDIERFLFEASRLSRRNPADCGQSSQVGRFTAMWRIVDQKCDAFSRIFHERRGHQRVPNDSFLLPIGGHQHGQGRRLVTVVDRFKLFARQRSVLAQPVQVTEARQLVDETSNIRMPGNRRRTGRPQAKIYRAARVDRAKCVPTRLQRKSIQQLRTRSPATYKRSRA